MFLFREVQIKKALYSRAFLLAPAALFFSSADFSDNKDDQCNKANY